MSVVLRALPARRFRALLGILALAFAALSASAVQSSEAFAASWATGVEASAPAGAGPDPGVALSSVSCPAAGDCSAVGSYLDSSGNRQGLLLTESAGTWTTGVEALLPADAGSNPGGGPISVSCAAAGYCSAVGNYVDSSGNVQGLLLTEAAGTWATGEEATPPADALSNTTVGLDSVSCTSPSACSAVGVYLDSSSHN